MIASPRRDSDLAKEFNETGFLVVPGALSAGEVSALNGAFDQYIRDWPQDWAHFSESFVQTADVLPRTDAFDMAIENPRTLSLLRALLGPDFSFEELSLMIRNPTETTGELKGWHRDIIRDFDRRFEINAISVVYYLTDVGPNDHCFSIVPRTHNGLNQWRPDDIRPGMEVDALGPAGSAFIFHARCIHAGKLKLGSRQRRTMHLYYGPSDQPRTSEWTTIPDRLAMKRDPGLPPSLYAKARMTETIDGTGRKPRDVPAGLSTAELLMHVQRAANRPGAQA